MVKTDYKWNDRERILAHATNLLGMYVEFGGAYRDDNAFIRRHETPQAGDLIYCKTGTGPWKISWMVENRGNGNALLRMVGRPDLCNYGNEAYLKIDYKRTIYADYFLEGNEFKLAMKIRKAIYRLGKYGHKLQNVEFDGPQVWGARRPCRVMICGMAWAGSKTPYEIPIQWNTKTTIRELEAQLLKGGYGDDHLLYPSSVSG